MLLVLETLPREVFVEDLELATSRFVSRKGLEVPEKELRRALSELQGNFIVLKQDQGNDIVAFHNPSVHDFINNFLGQNPTLYEALGKSTCFFEQAQWLCEKGMEQGLVHQLKEILLSVLQAALPVNPCTLLNYSSDRGRTTYKGRASLSHVERLAFIASLLKKEEFDFLSDMLRETLRRLTFQILEVKPHNADLLRLVKEVIVLDCLADLRTEFLIAVKESFYQNANWISDVSCLNEFLELCPEMKVAEDENRIIEVIDDIVNNYLDDDDPQLLSDELYNLEQIKQTIGFGLEEQIETVRLRLSSAEENCPPEEDYDDDRYRESSGGDQSIENDTLADMFSTLLR